MSDSESKEKRSMRMHKNKVKAHRQKKILKNYGLDFNPFQSENYYTKTHSLTCGNSNCVMCGNPRKFFGAKTVQEQRFDEVYKQEVELG